MFRRVEVPVLGVVENMSWYDRGDHRDYIFGEGGGARMAQTYSVELLGQLPLNTSIRQQADDGRPTVLAAPDSDIAQRYREIARRAAAPIAYGAPSAAFPTIEISAAQETTHAPPPGSRRVGEARVRTHRSRWAPVH